MLFLFVLQFHAKATAYAESYDGQTKWMYFLIENDDLLETYNTIWYKVGADIKRVLNLSKMKNFLKPK